MGNPRGEAPCVTADIDTLLRIRLGPVGGWRPTTLRSAAVVCPLVKCAAADCVLLLVRPANQRQHAGQIGFPGGMREGDESVEATARREFAEELGADASALTALGELPPRTSSTGIHVHAVVARLQPVALVPDPREVARVLHVPLAALLDEARWSERPAPLGAPGVQPATSPHFTIGADLLWGLTARFVRDLLAALRG